MSLNCGHKGPIVHAPGDTRLWRTTANDDADRIKLLIRLPELSSNPTIRVIW
jgi:hypothetical protein